MAKPIILHAEFARVIGCNRCSVLGDRHLLRDDLENVPQPGYIGRNYDQWRVLLVGQNPGTPKSLAAQDLPYTAALRALRDEPTPDRYAALVCVLESFIPQWSVHDKYFPLTACGLTLDDIAYCNIVRCRTLKDRAPGRTTANQCLRSHFARWLEFLAPRVVVFIGKWAAKRGAAMVESAGIPCALMNRQRSLSSEARAENRAEVVALVRSVVANRTIERDAGKIGPRPSL